MGLASSMWSGVSGLLAHGEKIGLGTRSYELVTIR